MKKSISLMLLMTAFVLPAWADDDDLPGLDVPGQEQKLNAELWRFAKNTSYEAVQKDLETEHEASRASATAEVTLPNGWRMAPAGNQLEVGRYPMVIVPFAGNLVVLNNGYYVETKPEITIVSGDGTQFVKTLTLPSLFPSARVGLDGGLYISGGYDQTLHRYNEQFENDKDIKMDGYSAGIAPLDKSHVAVALMLIDNGQGNYKTQGRLAVVNTETGKTEDEVDCGRLPHALEVQDGKIFVSLLSDNQVAVYSYKKGRLKRQALLASGKTPTAFIADPTRHKLYVCDQNSDEVTVINSKTSKLTGSYDLKREGFKFGSAPNSGTVVGDRIYVTLARFNAVAVLDAKDGKLQGYIPTGWYPTAVAASGDNLFTLSAKGIQPRRPNPNGPQPTKKREEPGYVLTLLKGSVGTIPLADIETKLPEWNAAVTKASPIYNPADGFNLPIHHIFYIVKENRTYDQVLGDMGKGNGDKDLCIFGKEISPNHHKLAEDFVNLDNFFVDGEISVLGHSYTTSGYASPFLEWLGMNDYAGKLGAKDATNPKKNEDFWPFGTVPFTYSPSYLWDAMDAKNVDYRVYGEDYIFFCKPYKLIVDKFGEDSEAARKCYDRFMEMSKDKVRDYAFQKMVAPYVGRNLTKESALKLMDDPEFLSKLTQFYAGDDSLAQSIGADADFKQKWADFLFHCSFNFVGWDLTYSDLKRVEVWQKDFEQQVSRGDVLPLHYIWLPNDHTAGLDPKALNPNQFMAQNDAAVGAVLNTIAKSPVWKDSLVLCIEDDSQNGPDHVDAMRSFMLAAGPYVKRQALVNDLYDQLGLLRTIESILGLDPMNLNDGLAAPLFSIFNPKPDEKPYQAPNPSKYLPEADKKLYAYLMAPPEERIKMKAPEPTVKGVQPAVR